MHRPLTFCGICKHFYGIKLFFREPSMYVSGEYILVQYGRESYPADVSANT